MDNNNQNQEKLQYANVNLFFKMDKADDLKSAVAVFAGDVFLEKKTGQYGDFVAVELYVTLRDKDVEYYFGKELVAADHKVKFEFLLGKHLYDRVTKYTPRWGQTVAFMLYDMEINSFPKKNGETGYSVRCKCSNYNVIGGTKKADGTERPVMKIKGMDAATNAAAPAQQGNTYAGPASVPGVSGGFQEDYEDDGELPF